MSLAATLEKALTGLRASQAGIDIVGRNLANVNTPGYTRKFQQLQPQTFGGEGAGVQQLPEARFVNSGVEKQFRDNFSLNENLKVLDDFLSRFEDAFGAPNADISIANEITKLADTYRKLAEKPDSVTAQNGVIAEAQQVARVLNQLTTVIQDLRTEADRQTAVSVNQVNTSLDRVKQLNDEIGTRFVQGLATGDLEDLRDVEVEKVAKEMDITYFTRGNNELVILTGKGRSLIEGPVSKLTFTNTSTISAQAVYPVLSGVFLSGTDIKTEITGGRIGAYLSLRDTRLANGAGNQGVIDSLASAMTLSFAARGVELFQDAGVTFLVANTIGYAGRIAVNPLVIANPWKTRDGTVVGAELTNARGDATTPLVIVDMFENTATFTSGIATGVNALISQNVDVKARADYQDNLTNALDQRRKNDSGVNTDQELQLMIQLQASYNAAARIIQTVQQMYDELFQIKP
jgi:flagellar hook-associated protein 1 FlgK